MNSFKQTTANYAITRTGKQNTTAYLSVIVFFTLLFAACQKQEAEKAPVKAQVVGCEQMTAAPATLSGYTGLNPRTYGQLLQARISTAKYRDIENAYADGYADIEVVKENMGYHFMRSDILDSQFHANRPELLVYNIDKRGNFELVAVEYAVPFDMSVNAPEGFTGNDDVWTHSDEFGLWLLHAWVWKYNPDGVFAPMNPNVHVTR